ncbi:hypothetical protein [Streptomyces coryli]|uniref:hypothetical protein n=1 Tax=Streptomyces coryli TaxID=1128680 RepID=UPI0019D09B80|nr:hypothetical protein [Streptomyces coryli]
MPGSATHMRAIRRWTGLSDSTHHAVLATIDTPLFQLGGIAIPYIPYPQSLPQHEPATVYAATFGTPVSGEQLAARTAAVTGHPLVPVRARAAAEAEPPAQQHFLTVDDSGVGLVGLTAPGEGTLPPDHTLHHHPRLQHQLPRPRPDRTGPGSGRSDPGQRAPTRHRRRHPPAV